MSRPGLLFTKVSQINSRRAGQRVRKGPQTAILEVQIASLLPRLSVLEGSLYLPWLPDRDLQTEA